MLKLQETGIQAGMLLGSCFDDIQEPTYKNTEAAAHLCPENVIPVIADVRADFDALESFDLCLFNSSDVLHAQKARHLLEKESNLTKIRHF